MAEGRYKEQFAKLVGTVEASKQDMVEHGGYDDIVIEDFYDVFLENL